MQETNEQITNERMGKENYINQEETWKEAK